jgi:hypothetical protein
VHHRRLLYICNRCDVRFCSCLQWRNAIRFFDSIWHSWPLKKFVHPYSSKVTPPVPLFLLTMQNSHWDFREGKIPRNNSFAISQTPKGVFLGQAASFEPSSAKIGSAVANVHSKGLNPAKLNGAPEHLKYVTKQRYIWNLIS